MHEKEEKTHFEIMEELGQLSIFDIEPAALPTTNETPNKPAAPDTDEQTPNQDAAANELSTESKIREGDRVTVSIPSDTEDYDYFKYYFPHALTVRGEVLKIENQLCHVRFKSDVLLLKQHELTL